jgi:hypothetical protein
LYYIKKLTVSQNHLQPFSELFLAINQKLLHLLASEFFPDYHLANNYLQTICLKEGYGISTLNDEYCLKSIAQFSKRVFNPF